MKDFAPPPQAKLRPASDVMRLRRLGASFPTRLSFLRTLLRRLSIENATVTCPVWEMSTDGYGYAVISVPLGGHVYSLVAVSTELDPDARTDRVIATAWDTAFVLYDGIPSQAEIDRIVATAPHQEASRFTASDLVLSRANKSVRLWSHVVERLQAGLQPDEQMVRETGYLMRTTAVYGNGKFGIADRADIAERDGLSGPFQAEMLTVWLIRHFTHLLVEHVGQAPLDAHLKRHLGIGNSTGLGMAPFLVTHPVLLNNWIMVRETALARIRALEQLPDETALALQNLAKRAAKHLSEWIVPDAIAATRISTLQAEWAAIVDYLNSEAWHEAAQNPFPIEALLQQAEGLSEDAQELLCAMIIEPFGDLVDGLEECMADPFGPPRLTPCDTSELHALINRDWAWATARDYNARDECAQFWYVSEEKLEPRLGNRHEEDGADLESPLDIARRVAALAKDLPASGSLTAFLATHPEHRFAAERVQCLDKHPYSEIRDNLIADTCLPIDMLRCKLSFFGASKFDPKSDRWTRVTLCQGAPLADELSAADDWWLPTFGS